VAGYAVCNEFFRQNRFRGQKKPSKDLAGPTRRPVIAQVRGLIGHIATREMSIPGSVVARRFKQDRSAVSRAA